jgi:hypothetical protein
MKVKKNYTKTEVLDAAKIGFEFEFYSSMDVFETAKDIAKYVKKRVVVPLALSALKDPKPLYHSPVTPTADIFKLEPDYSGGPDMRELVTGPIPYKDARNVLIKVFEWISSNGYTNERCSIHVNLSINENMIPTKFTITNINIPKFILSFDENKVFEVFPKRKDSVYARSIKEIRPNRVLFYSPSLEDFSRATLTLPTMEKYYGVNFLKAEKNYLEYRYLGGQDYEKKTKKILDLVDYFILHLYDTLNFEGFTDKEKADFKKLMEMDKKVYEGFVKHEHFAKMFPDIEVSVDMNADPVVLEAMWGNIREKLFDVIITGKVKKGHFNYDKEIGRFQLKDTKLNNCRLEGFEFINCKIEGVMNHCWFFDCDIKNSRIHDSAFMKGNTVDFSKVDECELHLDNTLRDCYIENKRHIINCSVEAGVVRSGEIGKLAKISKETLVIQGGPSEEGDYFEEKRKKEEEEEKKSKKDKK